MVVSGLLGMAIDTENMEVLARGMCRVPIAEMKMQQLGGAGAIDAASLAHVGAHLPIDIRQAALTHFGFSRRRDFVKFAYFVGIQQFKVVGQLKARRIDAPLLQNATTVRTQTQRGLHSSRVSTRKIVHLKNPVGSLGRQQGQICRRRFHSLQNLAEEQMVVIPSPLPLECDRIVLIPEIHTHDTAAVVQRLIGQKGDLIAHHGHGFAPQPRPEGRILRIREFANHFQNFTVGHIDGGYVGYESNPHLLVETKEFNASAVIRKIHVSSKRVSKSRPAVSQ